MKHKGFISLLSIPLIFLLSLPAIAVIPDVRRIDWNPGIAGDIPNYPIQTNLLDYGAVGNGIADDSDAFDAAIDATDPGNALLIPEGTYRLARRIYIRKGIVLRGEGSGTRVVFNHPDQGFWIIGDGPGTNNFVSITGGFAKGSTTITVSPDDISQFSQWCYTKIKIFETPGTAPGQMNRITAINNNTLTLERPLYLDYNTNSVIRAVDMVEGVGIENMHLITDSPAAEGYTNETKVLMDYAVNSWVRNVTSEGYAGQDYRASSSYKCEFRDSYFYHTLADAYSRSDFFVYGLNFILQTSDCLGENIIFDNHRHAIVAQQGPTGNVFAYCFSWSIFTKSAASNETERVTETTLFIHGQDTNLNLFESNNGELAEGIDENVYYNTWARNRLTQGGLYSMQNSNVVGNELPQKKYVHPTDDSNNEFSGTESGSIFYGNYQVHENRGLEPATLTDPIPDSYYLSEKPEWFGDLAWPAYGGDLMEAGGGSNPNRIPAEVRYWSMKYPEASPSNLTLQLPDSSTVELSWTNNSTNTVDFIICRSEDGTNYERIAITNQTTYTDTNIQPNTQYWYYVRARNYLIDALEITRHGDTATYTGPQEIIGGESDPSEVVNTGSPSPPADPEDSDDPDAPDQQIGELEIKSYPNPYEYSAGNPMTFEFSGITGISTLKIYSIAGRLIKTIELAQGQTTIQWDGKDENGFVVASGLYLYVLTTSEGKLKKGKFAFVK